MYRFKITSINFDRRARELHVAISSFPKVNRLHAKGECSSRNRISEITLCEISDKPAGRKLHRNLVEHHLSMRIHLFSVFLSIVCCEHCLLAEIWVKCARNIFIMYACLNDAYLHLLLLGDNSSSFL